MTLRRTALAAAVLLVLGASALATYALWGTSLTVPGGIVTSGDLDIELVGEPEWREAGSASPIAMQDDGLTAAHLATAGESYVLTQRFTTALEGDNLAARLTVAWAEPAALGPAGHVTATYQVTSPDAASSTIRPLGTPVTVPDVPANLTPADVASWGPGAQWVLEVTVTFDGPDVLVTPVPGDPPQVTVPAPVTDLGQIVLRLDQVRDGEGFTS